MPVVSLAVAGSYAAASSGQALRQRIVASSPRVSALPTPKIVVPS